MKRPIVSSLNKILLIIIVLAFVVSVTGCKKEDQSRERASKESVQTAANTVNKADEAIKHDAEKEKAALALAERWLTLIDTGKHLESWQEASDYFRKSVKEETWKQVLQSRRNNLGGVISRKFKDRIYKTAIPGEPEGQYIVVQYETSFQLNKSATEEVSAILEKNGRWKVSGYHLR
jgi:hypothetical protein